MSATQMKRIAFYDWKRLFQFVQDDLKRDPEWGTEGYCELEVVENGIQVSWTDSPTEAQMQRLSFFEEE